MIRIVNNFPVFHSVFQTTKYVCDAQASSFGPSYSTQYSPNEKKGFHNINYPQ
jgi:hypothetical protein